MSSFHYKKGGDRGFTLIELMMVISIIGLLSTVILGSLQRARLQANDAKRISEIRQMQTALELYFNDNGQYPSSDQGGIGGWDTPGDGTFLGVLAGGGYMPNIKDPTTNDFNGNYRYYRYAPTDPPSSVYYVCNVTKGAFYVLEIIQFEASSPRNPGFQAGTCDWTSQGEYVVGKFENG